MFQPKHSKTKGFLKSIPIVLFLCGRLLLYVTVLFLTMRCAPWLLLLLYWAPGAVVAYRPCEGVEGSVRSVWWTPLCGLAPVLLSIRSRSHIHYIVVCLCLSAIALCVQLVMCNVANDTYPVTRGTELPYIQWAIGEKAVGLAMRSSVPLCISRIYTSCPLTYAILIF